MMDVELGAFITFWICFTLCMAFIVWNIRRNIHTPGEEEYSVILNLICSGCGFTTSVNPDNKKDKVKICRHCGAEIMARRRV
jgi:hypothetical protein